MGEVSQLGCLIGWSTRDMWVDSFCLLQSARPSLLSSIFCVFLHMHVRLILISQAGPRSGYICVS
jgi:hypothetical protein